MSLLNVYESMVQEAMNPSIKPVVKNITLRLPVTVHGELERLSKLSGNSKTVVAERLFEAMMADVLEKRL